MPKKNSNLQDAIALGAILISFFSLFLAFYSVKSAERLSSSVFQVSENTKMESAVLLSALRSIIYKGIHSLEPERSDDYVISIDAEKKVIQSFLNSPSALAFGVLASEKSDLAREKGTSEEPWRIFLFRLIDLLYTDDPRDAAMLATEIEITYFEKFTERDFKDITKNLSDLSIGFPQAINRKDNIKVIFDIVREELKEREERADTDFLLGLLRLKFDTIPENIVAQVLAASSDQLEAWINKWTAAEDLDDIFGVD